MNGILPIALAAALLGCPSAQQPLPIPFPVVPIHTAEPDLGVEYGIWAAGADCKCSFHGDMTFVPYLGADHPCNRSVAWRTTSVRMGERELLEPGEQPVRWHDERRYEYRYTAITEAYDVRREGLEPPFVLLNGSASPPRCTFDPTNDRFLFPYSESTGARYLYGQAFEYATPAPWTNSGAGCSPAAIDWIGSQQIGAGTSLVAVTTSSVTAGHFVLVSLATADLPVNVSGVAGGCRLLVDANSGFLGTLPFHVGANPFWQFPLPEWLPPMTFHLQDWILDGTTFESTRRLSVPVVK